MATETTENNLFASLLNEAPAKEEQVVQDTAAKATAESTKETASASTEQATDDKDEILDSLTDDSKEEEVWDGKSPLNEHPRFRKLVTQRNEEREARKEVEARLGALESLSEAFSERYESEEDPAAAFRQDVRWLDGLNALYMSAPEEIKAQLEVVNEIVQEFNRTGKIPNGSPVKESRMSKSESNPQINNIARELWSTRVDALIDSTPIKDELKTVIRKHAMNSFNTDKVSKAHAKEVVSEFIKENGWSREFLLGQQVKSASTGAKPAMAAPAKRVESFSKSQDTTSKEEIKDPNELREKMRNDLASLLTQSQ